QKFSDAPIRDCPDCGAPVEKLMSLTSFSLKGTGWYSTDYGRAGGGKKAGNSSGSSGSGGFEASAAAEKPAAVCQPTPGGACGAPACGQSE
ncbi:MAG: hypothetical protein AB7P04_15810, partial [Bacteriovoracia bacterium]